MTDFKAAAESISKNNGEPEWLKGSRLAALAAYEKSPSPLKNDEAWRRTDVQKALFSSLSVPEERFSPARDTFLTEELSRPRESLLITPGENKDFTLLPLSAAANELPGVVRPLLEAMEARLEKKFAWLAAALWNSGLFLQVRKGGNAALPLRAFLRPQSGRRAAQDSQDSFFPRLLVSLEEGSSATLLLDEGSDDSFAGWADDLIQIHLAAGARLSLVKIQGFSRQTTGLGSLDAVLEKDASLDVLSVNSGSVLNKSDWHITLRGEGASARLFGLVKGEGTQHFDQTLLLEHAGAGTQSDALFKSALKDKARSVFVGLIHVQKGAKKADARQTNRNLLLSREARADTIPKLEIETEDVKCGHGAAVSSIDPDQLYYLMSRGLAREDAERILIEGFYDDVIAQWLDCRGSAAGGERGNRLLLAEHVREVLFGRGKTAETAFA